MPRIDSRENLDFKDCNIAAFMFCPISLQPIGSMWSYWGGLREYTAAVEASNQRAGSAGKDFRALAAPRRYHRSRTLRLSVRNEQAKLSLSGARFEVEQLKIWDVAQLG